VTFDFASSKKGNGMSVKNFDIVLSIRVLFPEAQIELDNEGQIIIYTGKYEPQATVVTVASNDPPSG